MKQVVARIIRHRVLANMLLVVTLMTGFIAANQMIRELFPEVSTRTVMITVLYPGADPEEVEEGVSRKIEEAIDGLEGVKRYTTVSSENTARAIVEVIQDYPIDKAKDNVENAIDAISTFPVDAEKPIVQEVLIEDEVILMALWGDMTEDTRKEFAEQIKDELQQIEGISKVDITGVRDYEIAIELSEERMREYGLSFEDISNALKRGSVNLSGGSLRTAGEQIGVRTVGRKYTGEELGSIVVLARPDGEIITLDRLATIRDEFTEDPVIATFEGYRCALLTIKKSSEEDTIAIAQSAYEYVRNKQMTLPEGVHLTAWADSSVIIDGRLGITLINGVAGLFLVLITLWMFLDLRLSFWVAMGIPFSVCGALIIMWAWGTTLNSITLFGLVMVLGIIVDDAIVIGESIYLHRRQGDGPLTAAINGLWEVGPPVIVAVATTIVAFLPLAFIKGVLGRFVGVMPVALCGALIFSLFEAMFLLPSHLSHLPDPNAEGSGRFQIWAKRNRRAVNRVIDGFVDGMYYPFLLKTLHYRYAVLCGAIAFVLATVGVVMGGFVTFVPFPQFDDNGIQATIEFLPGTPAAVTRDAVAQTEAALHDLMDELKGEGHDRVLKYVYTVVGENAGGRNLFPQAASGTHLGYVRVELEDSEIRGIHSQKITERWQARVPALPGALSQSFAVLSGGPPGKDIEIWLKGRDTDLMRAATDDLKAKLATYDGLYQIEDDYRPGKRELQIDVKPEARPLNVTLEDLARQVYAGFYGEEALRLQRGRDDVRVKVRYTGDERKTLADLDRVRIRTPQGQEVPFFSVADVKFGRGVLNINRVDGSRRISITSEVDNARGNAQQVIADLRANYVPEFHSRYLGITVQFEGAQQDSREGVESLVYLFPIALVVIFVIISTIFRSYMQPFIIMVTVPFGLIGAVYGHIMMDMSIVMFSMFGMMALTGVVVNDGIVLIEAVNTQLSKQSPVFDAIARGGARRFRAITLTTISTVGALFPLIIETNLAAQPLKPMALSVASGVGFATLITLFVIPCLLAILNDIRRWTHYLIRAEWPSREEVEPARLRSLDPLGDEEIAASPVHA